MKINHRHYILILFALIAIASSIASYIFLYKKTTAQASGYLNKTKQVEVEKNNVEYESNLLETFNKYKEGREKIESYIVKEEELVKFIEQIEQVGQASKTKLELSSIGSVDNKIKSKIVAMGTWTQVMTTLMMIENLPISLNISNVRLDVEGELGEDKDAAKVNKNWRLSLDVDALAEK